MPLPEFDSGGELPEGVHQASLDEVAARFGYGSPQRQLATERLALVYQRAWRTGRLERFIIFGSYVTAKSAPNDVDILLVMSADFLLSECDEDTAAIFDHLRAQSEIGASVFLCGLQPFCLKPLMNSSPTGRLNVIKVVAALSKSSGGSSHDSE